MLLVKIEVSGIGSRLNLGQVRHLGQVSDTYPTSLVRV